VRIRTIGLTLVAVVLVLTACTTTGGFTGGVGTSTPTAAGTDVCPQALSDRATCMTPHSLRVAYGVESLTERGLTGKGQTVVDIVSYGSPTLQQDMDVFDRQFGLPPITIKVLAPLGTVPFDQANKEMTGWAGETTLDVQIIHALAPDAGIVVLTSPVDETEGTIGLPQFLQLEQYAVQHHLGYIFSQSWTASEATLADAAGQQEVQTFSTFYQQIVTQQGYTVVNASGDNGATDFMDLNATKLSPTRTVGFPVDVPWVTAVGGTTLTPAGGTYDETAWSGSGGGVSKFFPEPSFQQPLPQNDQQILNGHRGLPDVAADANPATGMAFYMNGTWDQAGGTSAAAPLMAGIFAIANQMAGHPLGNVNPGIYKLGTSATAKQDFRDITRGNNNVQGDPADPNVQVQGYQAGPGWNAVTGWGAPRADHFIPDLIAALK
jgi:subtilase family serine protease